MLALNEAIASGCEEALLLDNEGYVAEGSGENVFIVRNGVLQDTIITFAKELGLEVRERRITRDEIYIAEEAFFTGTAAEVLPIRELDGRTIGAGKRGPVTEKLQSMYFDAVKGKSAKHGEWLTPVR